MDPKAELALKPFITEIFISPSGDRDHASVCRDFRFAGTSLIGWPLLSEEFTAAIENITKHPSHARQVHFAPT